MSHQDSGCIGEFDVRDGAHISGCALMESSPTPWRLSSSGLEMKVAHPCRSIGSSPPALHILLTEPETVIDEASLFLYQWAVNFMLRFQLRIFLA